MGIYRESREVLDKAMKNCLERIQKILDLHYSDHQFKKMNHMHGGFCSSKAYCMPNSSLQIKLEFSHKGGTYSYRLNYSAFVVVICLNEDYKIAQHRRLYVNVDKEMDEKKFRSKLDYVIAVAEVHNNWALQEQLKMHQNPLFKDQTLIVEKRDNGIVKTKLPDSDCVAYIGGVQKDTLNTVTLKMDLISYTQLKQILDYVRSLGI